LLALLFVGFQKFCFTHALHRADDDYLVGKIYTPKDHIV